MVSNSRTSKRIVYKNMERKVGEIFEVEGVKLQVVEDFDCGLSSVSCYFLDNDEQCELQKCLAGERKDRTSVKFLRIGD